MKIQITEYKTQTCVMISDEYLKVFKKYSEKYGEKTAVLYQVGSFLELYGVDNGHEKLGNAEELSRILNITLTRKSKKILENSLRNPLMLGFPCVAKEKYIRILLEEDYTVIVVDQVKNPKNPEVFRRKVVDVISPSTYIEGNFSANNENYLIMLYTDKHKHIGISAISLLTGNSVVHECYSDPLDVNKSFDDALSFTKQYRPREIVMSYNKTYSENIVSFSVSDMMSYFELDANEVLCHENEIVYSRYNIAYQNAILGCAFEFKDNLLISNIEHLHLERTPYALMSYVLLIEFVHNHNPMLLRKISCPDMWGSSDNLLLSTSTVDQLNITDGTNRKTPKKANFSTLFSLINKCSSNVGKRLLLRRILSPTSNINVLNKRYDQIDNFGQLPSDVRANIEHTLDKIVDVERLWRRMSVGIMCPPELAGLNASYDLVKSLNDTLKNSTTRTQSVQISKSIHDILLHDHICDKLSEFTDACDSIFKNGLESLLMSNMDTVEFKIGFFEDIDKLYSDIKKEKKAINDLASKISLYTDSDAHELIDYMQYSGYYVALSNLQTKKLKDVHDIYIKQNKAAARITSPSVDAANKKILIMNEKLKTLTSLRYKTILQFLSSEYSCLTSVAKFVSELDVIKSNWKSSKMYNYCRPEIIVNRKSFVDAKDLRHPVIEQIDDGNEYVPNDIVIGKQHNGIILYSMNSCGKTSLMKALGLSVIMAQAGCFVPASVFAFYPFKCIMTRILSRDNFMKGQSSFVAEMSELRAILKRATDSSTLVLADEITHGTEHTSGSAIFVSSVEALAKRKVNFLFTTHLHNVYPLVRDIPNVCTLHLSVAFADNKIIFERKLKDGPGGSIYGLEVCEYLNMDTDFLARAFKLRTMITPDKTEKEDSPIGKIKFNKYNKNKVKEICEMCGYYPRLPTDLPLDVHHIKPQSVADENGMIDGKSIHAKSNLIVLCKQCHNSQHS